MLQLGSQLNKSVVELNQQIHEIMKLEVQLLPFLFFLQDISWGRLFPLLLFLLSVNWRCVLIILFLFLGQGVGCLFLFLGQGVC